MSKHAQSKKASETRKRKFLKAIMSDCDGLLLGMCSKISLKAQSANSTDENSVFFSLYCCHIYTFENSKSVLRYSVISKQS